jgi:hypothetical protein
MTPILGILDSAKYGALHAGNYYSIATATVTSGGASAITFSSIPQTFTHLQLRATYIGSDVPTPQLNGDTGTNYVFHGLRGNGSTASAYSITGANNLQLGTAIAPTSTYPFSFIFDILDYTNTSKYKTTRAIGASDQNGSGGLDFSSGLWLNTSAINSITVKIGTGSANQYSSFALYGIK